MKLEDLLPRQPEQQQPTPTIPDYLINDPEVVGYPDIEMQSAIYSWAVEGINLVDNSVLDVGCGRGDLIEFTSHCKIFTGCDTKVALVTTGRKKYATIYPHFGLVEKDVLSLTNETFDYSFVVGTFNDITDKSKVEDIYNHVYNIANKAIIIIISVPEFNLHEIVDLFNLSTTPFKIDHSKWDGIFKLTIYK